MQEDCSPRCREITAYEPASPTNHTLSRIINDFPGVFVSGIVGEVEHL